MAYTINWNEAFPAGTNAANQLHLYIQQVKTMVRERVDDVFGTSGVTSIQNADPYLPLLIKLSGSPTSKIIPGTTSLSVRNAADTEDNLLVTDDGSVSVKKDFRIIDGQGYIDRFDNGNSTANMTIDFNNGNTHACVLTGAPNCTITLSNPKAGAFYTLEIKQGAGGSKTITWPASVKWSGGTAPTLSTTAGRTDIVSLYYNGTNYVGVGAGFNFDV